MDATLEEARVRWWVPVLSVVTLLAAWELAVHVFDIYAFILPAPSRVAASFVEDFGLLLEHTRVTALEVVVALGLATLLGTLFAVAITYSRTLREATLPLIVLTQALPKSAIAPVLLVALGYGEETKVVIAFLVCFFPIVLNTTAGFQSTPPELLALARSLSTRQVDVLRKFRVPFALPSIFVGLKLATTLAVIGVIVGEFVGSSAGLGYLILMSTASSQTALGFATMAALGAMSIAFYYAVVAVERLVIARWAG